MIGDLSAAETYFTTLREPYRSQARGILCTLQKMQELKGLPAMLFLVIVVGTMTIQSYRGFGPSWVSLAALLFGLAVAWSVNRTFVRPRHQAMSVYLIGTIREAQPELRATLLQLASENPNLVPQLGEIVRCL